MSIQIRIGRQGKSLEGAVIAPRSQGHVSAGLPKPRVLAIVQLPPPIHGASLMNHLVVTSPELQSKFDIRVVPLRFARSLADIGHARLGKLVDLVGVWSQVVRACWGRRPDLAYFTMSPGGWAFMRDLSIVALLRMLRMPILFHIHGRGMGPRLRPPVLRPLYRWAFERARVILLSRHLYEEVADLVPADRCFFVANGVPDAGIVSGLRDSAVADPPVRILFLSNMIPEKGTLTLLEAIRILKDRAVPVHCDFVGPFLTPSCQREFESLVIAYDLENHVTCVGASYGEDRYRYLRGADIFAFPSYFAHEAFPLAVLEAMSAGLPVVAAQTGAIPDMVDHGVTGLVVPPRSGDALAGALARLITCREMRQRMGESGRRKYVENYTVGVFVEHLANVWAACA